MDISPVGGVGQSTPRVQPAGPQAGPAVGTPTNSPTQNSPTQNVSTQQVSTQSNSALSSTQSTLILDPSAQPSTNLALAFYILNMLLQGGASQEEEDKFMMGLAAGLLAAEQQRDSRFFYSSSTVQSSSSTTIAGTGEVSAAYNTEMPNVAANRPNGSGPAADGAAMPVQRINTTA